MVHQGVYWVHVAIDIIIQYWNYQHMQNKSTAPFCQISTLLIAFNIVERMSFHKGMINLVLQRLDWIERLNRDANIRYFY